MGRMLTSTALRGRGAEASHEFTSRGVDWGFTTFMPLKDVLDPKRGFLKDDRLVVRAPWTMPLSHCDARPALCAGLLAVRALMQGAGTPCGH